MSARRQASVAASAHTSRRAPTYPRKIAAMVGKVDDYEYIVTESEQEALILECKPYQGASAAIQCAPEGRQELPIHQD